jgi:hypothetical protein
MVLRKKRGIVDENGEDDDSAEPSDDI